VRYLIIGDLHGNWRMLDALIDKAGVARTQDGREADGDFVVQLGDLINAVASSLDDDRTILARARKLIDVVLVGNHEHPYFGGPRFSGFWDDPELGRAVLAAAWQPSFLIRDVLLTHAGVTPEIAASPQATAREIHDSLVATWGTNRTAACFSQIGRARSRWSLSEFGGILWSDAAEPRAPFRQVHGHTPDRDGPRLPADPHGWTGSINLDVGMARGATRGVALWVEQDGSLGRLVEVELDPEESCAT